MSQPKKRGKKIKIDRHAVYNKLNGRCAYCGEKIGFKQMQVDHIRPQSLFYVGSVHKKLKNHVHKIPEYHVDDIRNLNPACRICNYWKHNFSVEEFRNEIQQQPKRLMRDSGKFRFAERHGVVEITNNPVKFYFETHDKGA